MNCGADIGNQVNIKVVGNDPYRLDADHDGIGCESTALLPVQVLGASTTRTQVATSADPSTGTLPFTGSSSALLAALALGAVCIGLVAKRRGDSGVLQARAAKRAKGHGSADEIRRDRVDRSHW